MAETNEALRFSQGDNFVRESPIPVVLRPPPKNLVANGK